jgi:hypothetical protein
MPRYVAPDRGVKETVIGGTRYNPDRGGIYNVENRSHGAAMKREGFIEASLNPITAADAHRGFVCVECGFNGWFRKCGRCGHESKDIPRDGE